MRRLFQPLTSQNSNDIISVSHRGAIIIPLLSLIAILLCGNNNDSTKKPRCKSSVLFLRGFLDALARVPVAPLGYRLRVAPGPRLPRRSLACGRFAPGAQIGLSRKRAKRPRPQWGLGGLAAASRSAFAPRGALKRFGPAPPRRSTSLNKRTRVKATPGFAALAFFRFALPCLVLRLVRLCSLAALLGRVPPAGAQLSPLAFLAASLACALRASSRLSAAGLSLGRYRSRRSLCASAAPPLFSASASIALSTTPPPRQSWRGAQGSYARIFRLVISSAIAYTIVILGSLWFISFCSFLMSFPFFVCSTAHIFRAVCGETTSFFALNICLALFMSFATACRVLCFFGLILPSKT